MTLATKNGSLIVKDGSLAENCGCCGGWYCCPEPACFSGRISSVKATLLVDDYLQQSRFDYIDGFDGSTYFSSAIPGTLLSREYTLSAGTSGAPWYYTGSDCRDATLSFEIKPVVLSGVTQYQAYGSASFYALGYYAENVEEYRTASQMLCTNACTGSRAVLSGGKYRNGTYKCSIATQRELLAFKLLGKCEPSLLVAESGLSSVNALSHPQYYFQSQLPQRTITVVSSSGPFFPKASVRFEVVIS